MITLLTQQLTQSEPPGEMLIHTWLFTAFIIALIAAVIYLYIQDNIIKKLKKEIKQLKKDYRNTAYPG